MLRALQRAAVAGRQAASWLRPRQVHFRAVHHAVGRGAAGVTAPPQLVRHWRLPPSLLATAAWADAGPAEVEEVELELPTHCSGCGVDLQQDDPDAPG